MDLIKPFDYVLTPEYCTNSTLYDYGFYPGPYSDEVAADNYKHLLLQCDKKCWSNWAGTDYNPLTNNCNTFTSTVLSCVYGLSQHKPSLGPSDLVTVSGRCPATATEEAILV